MCAGSLYRVAEELTILAQDLGIKLQQSCTVTEVIVRHGRAEGVVTDDGSPASGRRRDLQRRLPGGPQGAGAGPAPTPLDRPACERRGAEHLGLPAAAGHTGHIPPAPPTTIRSWPPTATPNFPTSSTRTVRRTTRQLASPVRAFSDPSRAPAGFSNLFVMTNPPALGNGFDWRAARPGNYRERVLGKLEAMRLTGLRERIVCGSRCGRRWTCGRATGRIAGRSTACPPNGWRQAFLRPPQVSPDVRGLYFVGREHPPRRRAAALRTIRPPTPRGACGRTGTARTERRAAPGPRATISRPISALVSPVTEKGGPKAMVTGWPGRQLSLPTMQAGTIGRPNLRATCAAPGSSSG